MQVTCRIRTEIGNPKIDIFEYEHFVSKKGIEKSKKVWKVGKVAIDKIDEATCECFIFTWDVKDLSSFTKIHHT